MPMQCRKCERESVLEDVAYCPFCGEKLPVKIDLPMLEEYTNGEVKEHFKKLYELAVSIVEYKVEHGYDMKDERYWCYEAVMDILGEDVNKQMNRMN